MAGRRALSQAAMKRGQSTLTPFARASASPSASSAPRQSTTVPNTSNSTPLTRPRPPMASGAARPRGARRLEKQRERNGEQDRAPHRPDGERYAEAVAEQPVAERGGDAAHRSDRVEDPECARQAVLLDEFAPPAVEDGGGALQHHRAQRQGAERGRGGGGEGG